MSAATMFQLDGRTVQETHPTRYTAAHLLRRHCGVASARVSCDEGDCGACSILVDSQPHSACTLFAWQLHGRIVQTASGLIDGDPFVNQVALRCADDRVFQCGFCAPGLMVALAALGRDVRQTSDLHLARDLVRSRLRGNICRCTGYVQLLQIVDELVEGVLDGTDEAPD